ncbi:MAG: tetratricopeptide repeat protein [Propylenella sp.]
MMQRAAFAVSTLLMLAAGQQAAAQSVGDRIEQGLTAAGEALPVKPKSGVEQPSIAVKPETLGDADVSLAASAGASRLRTTLDPIGIEQRIDKGLTAAGEASAFPPDYAFGAFQRGWFLTAFALALERAEAGDAVAQTLLGVLLSRGLGVKQDLAAAADWFRLAGKGGDAEALYALGQFYVDGRGVEKDTTEAAKLFRQAADNGHAGAARELGYLLLAGNGAEQNAMLAAAYFSRAARLGDMDAQYTLAGLFVEGVGVVGDESQAARWFAEAAKNGHVGAQVEYGILLFNGRGVGKDETAALTWFARAAEADNPAAQLRLARLLAEGRGAPKDEASAARWYLIAKAGGAMDEFMEGWLRRLDPKTHEKAAAAAEEWTAARRGPALASAQPAERRQAVDNTIE